MQLVPSKYFLTSGQAVSSVSPLNAFDKALMSAGICEQNLVAVSSVIPCGAVKTERTEIPMGAVTHCVMSQIRGKSGEYISAGIAYAYRSDGHGGYVAEGHIHGSGETLRSELDRKMKEMSEIRGIDFTDTEFVIEEMQVAKDMYGCCISALVFTEYR